MKYVIIGNSTAAIGAVEAIRSLGKGGESTIISDEKHHTYSRPLISCYLKGNTDLQRIKYRPDDFYKKNHCEFIGGVAAEKIDSAEKTVLLTDGKKIAYDKLLVATGSSPFVPPFEGLETVEKRFSFMKLDDALALEKAINRNTRVLIIGAGLIGLKCAEAIKDRAAKITVTDLSDKVLSSILDDDGAQIVKNHLESAGIEFILGDSAERFEGGRVFMKSGKTIEFDVLVTAVGVRPNIALVKAAGGETDKGIITDSRMQTSLPDVYAAGDCVESVDISDGKRKTVSVLPDAYLGGECAGINMAGGEKSFDNSIAMNSIGFFGLHIVTAGSYNGEVYTEKCGQAMKKLFYSNNRLNGFIIIGCIEKSGIYTSLIRNQTPLDTLDFDLVKKNPTLIAFERGERKAKLGGEV